MSVWHTLFQYELKIQSFKDITVAFVQTRNSSRDKITKDAIFEIYATILIVNLKIVPHRPIRATLMPFVSLRNL